MWETTSIWFEISVLSTLVALGHIAFGLFEERTSRIKKLIKFIVSLILGVSISLLLGRIAFLIFLFVFLVLVFYLHFIYLPSKGINGWTGEPKKKYYEFRGWDTNIFEQPKNKKL